MEECSCEDFGAKEILDEMKWIKKRKEPMIV